MMIQKAIRPLIVARMSTLSSTPALPIKQHSRSLPLLECSDPFYCSHDGVARTFYHVPSNERRVGIEERYNLATAEKIFLIRQQREHNSSVVVMPPHARGITPMGPEILPRIRLQEIDQGVLGSAGTGATTWEASIAMGMALKPVGRTVEVGCGVGLGGILLSALNHSHMTSLTMTDGNDEVLQQCQQNTRANQHLLHTSVNVERLIWGQALDDTDWKHAFDTVIACDCAYLPKHVESLSYTLVNLLAPNGTLHLMGPHNRAALHNVSQYLHQNLGMDVTIRGVEQHRYRLQPQEDRQDKIWDECIYASRATETYWHVVVKHPTHETSARGSLQDID